MTASVPEVGVLFDLDGTLVDREHLLGAALVAVAEADGAPSSTDSMRAFVGSSWRDVHAAIAPDEPFAPWHERVLDVAAGLLADGFPVRTLHGGRELVLGLVEAGVRVGIVTGSTRRELRDALAELDLADRFDVTVTTEDYAPGKPHPAGYLLGAERLGVAPGRCVAVEDSEVGVAAARAAGMRVVGTTAASDGSPAPQDLSSADLVVAGLDHLEVATVVALVDAGQGRP